MAKKESQKNNQDGFRLYKETFCERVLFPLKKFSSLVLWPKGKILKKSDIDVCIISPFF